MATYDPAENFNAIDPTYISNVLDYEQHIAENGQDSENIPVQGDKENISKKRASMSFKTALSLSFTNLMTKIPQESEH